MTLEDRVARIESILGIANDVADVASADLATVSAVSEDPAVADLDRANAIRAAVRQIEVDTAKTGTIPRPTPLTFPLTFPPESNG